MTPHQSPDTAVAWSETFIARALCTQFLNRRCVVLVPNTKWTGYECDVLAVTTDLRIVDIEIKISRADLKADAKKDKWWHRGFGAWNAAKRDFDHPPAVAREWPEEVWKHYYALPADIWKPELLAALPSTRSGVLLLRQQRSKSVPVAVECVRRATPNKAAKRLTPAQAVDLARLANLRMWDALQRMAA